MYLEVKDRVRELLKSLKLDIDSDDNLIDTPERVCKMYVDELFYALYNPPPKITDFNNEDEEGYLKYDQMVIVKDIHTFSVCSHHLIPFFGSTCVAYLPGKKVIGLSKIIRIVQYFGKKPQLQERYSQEIADYLIDVLGTEDVAVYMECKHLCYAMRGIKEPSASTITSVMEGRFRESNELRTEFFNLIK